MNDQPPETDWLDHVHALGLDSPLSAALDVLEPFGPLGAQFLWVAQPVLGLFLPRDLVGGLAGTLEEPGGVARLRQRLDELESD